MKRRKLPHKLEPEKPARTKVPDRNRTRDTGELSSKRSLKEPTRKKNFTKRSAKNRRPTNVG